mgnify:CR=1 FL=1
MKKNHTFAKSLDRKEQNYNNIEMKYLYIILISRNKFHYNEFQNLAWMYIFAEEITYLFQNSKNLFREMVRALESKSNPTFDILIYIKT